MYPPKFESYRKTKSGFEFPASLTTDAVAAPIRRKPRTEIGKVAAEIFSFAEFLNRTFTGTVLPDLNAFERSNSDSTF
jgi:hypothetical protein